MSSPDFTPDLTPESDVPVTVAVPKIVRVPNRQTAGILGVVLGFTGAHHYYLGSNGAGISLLATACCGVGIVVGVVEGVMLLAMSDEEFHEKYIRRRPDAMEFVFQERP